MAVNRGVVALEAWSLVGQPQSGLGCQLGGLLAGLQLVGLQVGRLAGFQASRPPGLPTAPQRTQCPLYLAVSWRLQGGQSLEVRPTGPTGPTGPTESACLSASSLKGNGGVIAQQLEPPQPSLPGG